MELSELFNPYSHQGSFTRKCARAEMPDAPKTGEGIEYCIAIGCRRLVSVIETCELLGKITAAKVHDCHRAGYEDPFYPADSTIRHYANRKGAE